MIIDMPLPENRNVANCLIASAAICMAVYNPAITIDQAVADYEANYGHIGPARTNHELVYRLANDYGFRVHRADPWFSWPLERLGRTVDAGIPVQFAHESTWDLSGTAQIGHAVVLYGHEWTENQTERYWLWDQSYAKHYCLSPAEVHHKAIYVNGQWEQRTYWMGYAVVYLPWDMEVPE